jgi:hypothetical protein
MITRIATSCSLFAGLALALALPVYAETASDFRLLDLTPVSSDRDGIATTLLQWDGLVKTPEFGDIMATDIILARVKELQKKNDQLPMPTILRFYPRGVLREVYRVDFFYEDYQSLAGLRILYRPFHSEYSNKPEGTDIEAVMKQVSTSIGKPTQRLKRKVVGFPSYNAYIWQDDAVRISLDYEAQNPARPVVLQLTVKDTDMDKQYLFAD